MGLLCLYNCMNRFLTTNLFMWFCFLQEGTLTNTGSLGPAEDGDVRRHWIMLALQVTGVADTRFVSHTSPPISFLILCSHPPAPVCAAANGWHLWLSSEASSGLSELPHQTDDWFYISWGGPSPVTDWWGARTPSLFVLQRNRLRGETCVPQAPAGSGWG